MTISGKSCEYGEDYLRRWGIWKPDSTATRHRIVGDSRRIAKKVTDSFEW